MDMTKPLPIKEIVAALGFLTGAVTFVYGLGFKNANKENSNADLVQTVTDLKQTVMDLKDTVVCNSTIQRTLIIEVAKQGTAKDKLTNSVTSLALKVAASPLEFAKIMEGKTFEVIPQEPTKSMEAPELRIKITPQK
jgi:hypothetical protein